MSSLTALDNPLIFPTEKGSLRVEWLEDFKNYQTLLIAEYRGHKLTERIGRGHDDYFTKFNEFFNGSWRAIDYYLDAIWC